MRLSHWMIILCRSNEEAWRQAGNALSSDKSGQDFASTEANVTAISGEYDQGRKLDRILVIWS